MVYFMENPIYKWMMTGRAPIIGNHHIWGVLILVFRCGYQMEYNGRMLGNIGHNYI